MAEGFLLGAHHGLTEADVDRVCGLLIEFDRRNGQVEDASSAGTSLQPAGMDATNLDF